MGRGTPISTAPRRLLHLGWSASSPHPVFPHRRGGNPTCVMTNKCECQKGVSSRQMGQQRVCVCIFLVPLLWSRQLHRLVLSSKFHYINSWDALQVMWKFRAGCFLTTWLGFLIWSHWDQWESSYPRELLLLSVSQMYHKNPPFKYIHLGEWPDYLIFCKFCSGWVIIAKRQCIKNAADLYSVIICRVVLKYLLFVYCLPFVV